MEKYLDGYCFTLGRVLIKVGRSWRLGYYNFVHDTVMKKYYVWVICLGPLSLSLYQKDLP